MRVRGRKGTERRRKRKGEGGKERRCAVGIFNYFRLCRDPLPPKKKIHARTATEAVRNVVMATFCLSYTGWH